MIKEIYLYFCGNLSTMLPAWGEKNKKLFPHSVPSAQLSKSIKACEWPLCYHCVHQKSGLERFKYTKKAFKYLHTADEENQILWGRGLSLMFGDRKTLKASEVDSYVAAGLIPCLLKLTLSPFKFVSYYAMNTIVSLSTLEEYSSKLVSEDGLISSLIFSIKCSTISVVYLSLTAIMFLSSTLPLHLTHYLRSHKILSAIISSYSYWNLENVRDNFEKGDSSFQEQILLPPNCSFTILEYSPRYYKMFQERIFLSIEAIFKPLIDNKKEILKLVTSISQSEFEALAEMIIYGISYVNCDNYPESYLRSSSSTILSAFLSPYPLLTSDQPIGELKENRELANIFIKSPNFFSSIAHRLTSMKMNFNKEFLYQFKASLYSCKYRFDQINDEIYEELVSRIIIDGNIHFIHSLSSLTYYSDILLNNSTHLENIFHLLTEISRTYSEYCSSKLKGVQVKYAKIVQSNSYDEEDDVEIASSIFEENYEEPGNYLVGIGNRTKFQPKHFSCPMLISLYILISRIIYSFPHYSYSFLSYDYPFSSLTSNSSSSSNFSFTFDDQKLQDISSCLTSKPKIILNYINSKSQNYLTNGEQFLAQSLNFTNTFYQQFMEELEDNESISLYSSTQDQHYHRLYNSLNQFFLCLNWSFISIQLIQIIQLSHSITPSDRKEKEKLILQLANVFLTRGKLILNFTSSYRAIERKNRLFLSPFDITSQESNESSGETKYLLEGKISLLSALHLIRHLNSTFDSSGKYCQLQSEILSLITPHFSPFDPFDFIFLISSFPFLLSDQIIAFSNTNESTEEYRILEEGIEQIIKEEDDKLCINCLATNIKLRVCSRCKKVRYCSRECQLDDWPMHKQFCSISSNKKN